MKLKIRYENEMQTLELNAEDTEQLWISLSLDGEGLSQNEREQKIQEAWDEQYNKPEYNNWHKHQRHIGLSKAKPGKDDTEDAVDTSEPLLDEVSDKRIFFKSMIDVEEKLDEEEIRKTIRAVLKPDYAEMVIGIVLEEMSVTEYAESIGDTRTNVSHRLQRALKKLKEFYQKTSR